MPTRNTEIHNRRGRALAARLDLPEGGAPQASAVLVPCLTSEMDHPSLARMAHTLSEHGFAVVRFDSVGVGEREGEPFEAGFDGYVDDVEDAATWLTEAYAAPALLAGHALGGYASIFAAARLPGLRALATIAAPSHGRDVAAAFEDDPDAYLAGFRHDLTLDGEVAINLAATMADLAERDALAALATLKVPLLVLHSVTDAVVSVQHAEALFRAARDPRKAYVSLGQADHRISKDADARFAGNVLGAWAASLLDVAGETMATKVPAAAQPRLEERISRAVTEEGYATDAYAGGHPMRFDEPLGSGGSDTGPTPVEVLRSALAACTTITLRMYANRKEWPLERITCDVTSKSERRDGEVFTHFERRIELIGDLDAEQRKRILEIADRCPVHRSLEGTVTIETVER